MTLISRTTLTTSAASVTFSSIPQTFQTLKLVVSARADGSSQNLFGTFNTSSSNFTWRYLYGVGSGSGGSGSGTNNFFGEVDPSTATASTFSNSVIDIPNYTGAANKAFSSDHVWENNATAANQLFFANLWSNTSAITSIGLTPNSGLNFVSGSTFSLYGVS